MSMKRRILPVLLFFLTIQPVVGQEKPGFYTTLWSEVHQYELKYLPKSALARTDSIYARAKSERNYVQLIKAMIFQAKFATIIKEDHELHIVNRFKSEIAGSDAPFRNIGESILANIYWQYYQKNRWKYFNRTKTSEKIDKEDFRTWDLSTLFQEIHLNFQNSLRNPARLQAIDLGEIDELLIKHQESRRYRPTLYDFLAHNALAFYKTSESRLTEPVNKFKIRDKRYFDSSYFGEFETAIDSLSLDYNALQIYRRLCRFHEMRKDTAAYLMLETERLEFLRNHGTFDDAEALYFRALRQLKAAFSRHAGSALVDFKLAHFLFRQGNTYTQKRNDTLQFKKKEALAICEQAIDNFPESTGARQCRDLRENILTPFLSLLAERFIPLNTPSRILVRYNNIDHLRFTVLKISEDQKVKFQSLSGDSSRLAFVEQLKQLESWDFKMINQGDHQEHSTEAVLAPLNQGQYMILARPPGQENIYGYAFTQVTNLVLVENSMEKLNRYQVLNRNNGSPVAGANIHLSSIQSDASEEDFDKVFVTDEQGFAFVKKDDNHYGSLHASVTTAGDTARFKHYYLPRNYHREGEKTDAQPIHAKPFIFTDRSIYRPGQKVFFKGILTKKQGDKVSIVPDEFVEVYFYDPNEEEISLLRLKTNEFGTFSGEFTIPSTGLTGEYSISAEEDYEGDSKFYDDEMDDFEWNELYISVEEYKRPRFEVSFDPVKASFKLKDSILVKGKAVAFTGAPVTRAKVVYRVTRQVRYPPWYYWRNRRGYHSSPSQEITNGETTTTADGSFVIDFKALPDEQVPKDNLPVFEYLVTADITDINGETRGVETIVKVGYHTMNLAIGAPAVITKNRKHQPIALKALNLNGQKVTAKGTLYIYQRKSPGRLLRNRPWPAPDLPVLPEEEFVKLFPHDSYGQAAGKESQAREKLVYTAAFDTAEKDSLLLPVGKLWEAGDYVIEAKAVDEFGQQVVAKRKFRLGETGQSGIPENKMVFHTLDKAGYFAGEKAVFTIASASKDVTVTIDVEKASEVVSTHIVHLSNSNYSLKIPVDKSDTEGFAIHYHLVNFNDFRSNTHLVNVLKKEEKLQIETETFRDKLLPGAKETWSFRIKGPGRGRLEAEVLAAMYDASLDQFKPHQWQFNPFPKSRYHSSIRSRAHNCFGYETFTLSNLPYASFHFYQQQFDRLDWFGFTIDNNRNAGYQYLNRLRTVYFDTTTQVSKVSTSNNRQQQAGFISGQTKTVGGELLPGVNVLIKGTNKGTISDINGRYSIRVMEGQELEFSFIGYVDAVAKIGKDNTIDVELAPDTKVLSEVVVLGYGAEKSANITGSVVSVTKEEAIHDDVSFELAARGKLNSVVEGITITNQEGVARRVRLRGGAAANGELAPLYIVDGVPVAASEISENDLASINVLQGEAAIALYGNKGAHGVILITTISGQKKMDEALAKVRARRDLRETAFFYPHLKAGKKGNVSFSFTTPEALTRWKLQLLAHKKNLVSKAKTLQAVTTKDLMITPNAPRFLRQGDEVVIAAKITNLTDRDLEGFAGLRLSDPFSGESADEPFQNSVRNQPFKVGKRGNAEVSWRLVVPEDGKAVQYKILASSGDFSDGEQNILPILSNRTLVTETLPMHVNTGESGTFTLNKLKTSNSPTLEHHQLTLEVTSNPTWYALQALPYLMEFPYQCAEQTFARYYANALGRHIVNQHESVRKVFKSWGENDGLSGNLEKNESLKSIMIQETPWLRDALSEKGQKARIARLFDDAQMQKSLEAAMYDLEQMQLANGGFPWFSGSTRANRYITQHIMAGLAHLQHLNVTAESYKTKYIVKKGLKFLEKEIVNDYNVLHRNAERLHHSKSAVARYMNEKHIQAYQVHYLYLLSYFPDSIIGKDALPVVKYYKEQSANYWQSMGIYAKGMVAIEKFRSGEIEKARSVLNALRETSITNEEMGMYWKANADNWRWNHAPIETQALLIEAFSEIEAGDTIIADQQKQQTIDNLKIWLLKNKQTNRWRTTKSTTEAIYALLLKGSDWLTITEAVDITVGNEKIIPGSLTTAPEAGTGYFKKSWTSRQIDPAMSKVTLTKKQKGTAWAGLYWQYFEDLDKITPAETPLKLSKSLFRVAYTEAGELLHPVTDTVKLTVGDLIRVRIVLTADRSMEFVHMKDMRAAGTEPVNVLSTYKWQDGLGYYESTRDASTNFFFEAIWKGVYVFEYDLRINNSGNFSNGITTIQSMYAPEFSSHSEGIRVVVE